MAFTVQWTTSKGCVSVVRLTALSAYQEAERVTKLGMRNVGIRLSNGELIDWRTFSNRASNTNLEEGGMKDPV
ncbi:hypothetical protein LPC10_00585 [Methylorubrum sp. B1-46]|uniref:hypothetical protein n=1 Tax=Methylorubrum sp. B1-46 TaxID=2897334 RepID=UPI000A3E3345|nr:hypothetical protein [Methylorubrum sp. B1-46]UGB26176.1 hypothetical protein LPC10_00585 [Methylorubrum sp. B1-46]